MLCGMPEDMTEMTFLVVNPPIRDGLIILNELFFMLRTKVISQRNTIGAFSKSFEAWI